MGTPHLITASDLRDLGDDPKLRVVDATVHLRFGDGAPQIESGQASYLAGHIPGAVNRPFTGALNPDGTYRDADGLRTHLNTDNAPTIAYCGSGVSATPNLLARELAGMPLGPQNRLYPGSWSDWITDPERPGETG